MSLGEAVYHGQLELLAEAVHLMAAREEEGEEGKEGDREGKEEKEREKERK